MDQPRNASQHSTGSILVFGFVVLPQKYEVEGNVVVTLVGIMSLICLISNITLLFVIINDPLKQLRNITAILLAFNSVTNTCISLALFMESVSFWSGKIFFPELVVYLISSGSCLYFIGNLLHTLNIYGTIVAPLRYAYFASKFRKILVPFLVLISIVTLCVIIIPPYTLPENKVPSYAKGVMSFVCVQLVLLTIIFIYLYTRVFQALHARKERLAVSFHIKSSTPQGIKVMKKNYEVAKTLFIHVLFFVIATAPESLIVMLFLHCTSCGERAELQLATLFSIPFFYTTAIFHPFLWLCRLNNYKQAMKESLRFGRRSRTIYDVEQPQQQQRTGTLSTLTCKDEGNEIV